MPRSKPNPPPKPAAQHQPAQDAQPPIARPGARPPNHELSPTLRKRICQAHADGLGYKAIARQFSDLGLCRETIRSTIRKESSRVGGISKPRTGRPRKITEAERERFLKEARENPGRSMRDLHRCLAPHVGYKTFARALKKGDGVGTRASLDDDGDKGLRSVSLVEYT